jgi:BlaI family transcriptional regulator, penicillinase repressor
MIPKIAVSEWRIMKLLWKKSPRTSNEIIERLAGEIEWNPKTVKTLLNRLVNKKAIDYEKEGRSYLYFPLLKENECQRVERKTFLNRVYNGALQPMFAAFLEEEKLSKDEIDELKKILEKKGK